MWFFCNILSGVFCQEKKCLNYMLVHNLEVNALNYFYNSVLLEEFWLMQLFSVRIFGSVETCRSPKAGTSNNVG